jgi:hypothetical protein
MNGVYIGIDPGKSGAITILYNDNSLKVMDITDFYDNEGAARISLNPLKLNDWIDYEFKDGLVPVLHVCCEEPVFMPGFTSHTTMSMFESFGVFRTLFLLRNISFSSVRPGTWIKSYPELYHPKKKRDKAESVALAQKLFPTHADIFERTITRGRTKGNKVLLDGRAESTLIALYGKNSSGK